MKNILIYIFVCVVILFSFKMPEILLEMENKSIETKVYKKEKSNLEIDVEAEKIYLVKAIHDMNSENTKVAIASSLIVSEYSLEEINEALPSDISIVNKELEKLKAYNILQNFEIKNDSKFKIEAVERYYRKEDVNYLANGIELKIDDKSYNMGIESKTGKIIFMFMERSELNTNVSMEEILRNYVKYLDLYIIDDWIFENNILESKKAGLVVGVKEMEEEYFLFVRSKVIFSDGVKNFMEY